jgi:EF-hand domain pair
MCLQLDADGNGHISLDEFLHYFEHLEESDQTEYEKMRAEEELFDNIWPEWIIKESKIDQAKKIIERMHEGLKKTLGISAELAFETYETSRDKGQVTVENFKKVLKQFFNEARLTPEEIEFVIKMTPRTVDQ